MLQEYIQNVSILCCNKCFHVAICKCFFDVTCVSHTHVTIVCSKCFICFSRMLHPSFHVSEVESHEGHVLGAGDGARQAVGRRLGRAMHLRSCGRGVLILMPSLRSRPPRDRGGGQREGAAGVRASRLVVTEREEGAKGEGAAGAAFSAGTR
jgi:hypothetical protein